MTAELIALGAELIGSLSKLVFDALATNDPTKLRKVKDALPEGPLQSRLALLEAKASAAESLKHR